MNSYKHPLRVGVGGPVGSGKTALLEALCKAMRDTWQLAVVTNDIYTKEDQRILTEAGALAPERIVGVETGGCPHTAERFYRSRPGRRRRRAAGVYKSSWLLLGTE